MKADYDIVIVGGGLVGASLALALQSSNKSVLLIEKYAVESQSQPSFDQRTIALTYNSKLIFQSLGIWQEIEKKQCQTISDIHISDRGHFGQTHLSHKLTPFSALGYVISSSVIGAALWRSLHEQTHIDLESPAEVLNCQQHPSHCQITVVNSDKQTTQVTSKLIIVADGGRSNLVDTSNMETTVDDYQQTALLCLISTDKPHNGRAYERFTEQGPIALLPYTPDDSGNDRYAVVWTCANESIDKYQQINDVDFTQCLQQAFGYRAGLFFAPSTRKAYPLSRKIVKKPVQERLLIMGNAAHTVHPVAGQGFNLGLRDVALLADLIATTNDLDGSVFTQFQKHQQRQTVNVSRFTHGLIKIFGHPSKTVSLARNTGLALIELSPNIKKLLLNRTMGMTGYPSSLLLGQLPRPK